MKLTWKSVWLFHQMCASMQQSVQIFNYLSNDVTVILKLFNNHSHQPFIGYEKEVYYSEIQPTPSLIPPYCFTYTCLLSFVSTIYFNNTRIFFMFTFEYLNPNRHWVEDLSGFRNIRNDFMITRSVSMRIIANKN